jgi:hypothetical protein
MIPHSHNFSSSHGNGEYSSPQKFQEYPGQMPTDDKPSTHGATTQNQAIFSRMTEANRPKGARTSIVQNGWNKLGRTGSVSSDELLGRKK